MTGNTMQAAVVPSVGGKWEVREVSIPEPGPNQVLIRIHASGLCFTDVQITNGAWRTEFPRTLGHEPAGEIVAVGLGVHSRKVGDRVGVPWVQASCGRCEWCMRGKFNFCAQKVRTGVQTQGSHAEYMQAWADGTVLLPEGVSYDQAAPVFCAGYTVWSGLRIADPKPHDRIAVHGVGGLGHLGLQFAKAAGFDTFAISHSKDKYPMIRDLGADEVVGSGEELKAIGGADVILSTSSSYRSASEALNGLRPDGRLVLIGMSNEPLEVTSQLMRTRGRIIGSLQNGNEYLYEALDYVARGKVRIISETYRLNEVGKAYERLAEGQVRYRAVLTF